MPYLSASEVMIHEEVLYQVCIRLPFYKVGLLYLTETVMNDGDVDANDNICLQVVGSNSGGPDN